MNGLNDDIITFFHIKFNYFDEKFAILTVKLRPYNKKLTKMIFEKI